MEKYLLAVTIIGGLTTIWVFLEKVNSIFTRTFKEPMNRLSESMQSLSRKIEDHENGLLASKEDREKIHGVLDEHDKRLDKHDTELAKHKERIKTLFDEKKGSD